jgi:hypothetical protein
MSLMMTFEYAARTVVQFAKGRINGEDALFALKFFTSRQAFVEERRIVQDYPVALREFMPEVMEILENQDQSLKDPFGYSLSPCIVMEKGESLRDRANDSAANLFTMAQVHPLSCTQVDVLCFHLCCTNLFPCRSLVRTYLQGVSRVSLSLCLVC